MARWKLMTPHYLNVAGTKWEYQEVSRTTGKTIRQQISVPTYLDPRDPSDFTHKWGQPATPGVHSDIEGEIIVSRGPSIDARDIVFVGDPTPDMVPIDDEAKAISAKFEKAWDFKPDTVQSFSQSLVDQLQVKMSEVQTKPAPVQVEGLGDLVAAMSKMMEINQQMVERLAVPARRF